MAPVVEAVVELVAAAGRKRDEKSFSIMTTFSMTTTSQARPACGACRGGTDDDKPCKQLRQKLDTKV